MRIMMLTAGSLIAATMVPALPAQAAPSGSYQQSCNSVRDDGRGQMSAQCRDVRGRFNWSSLDYSGCRGDIGNNNGQLVCNGGRPGGGNGGNWGGGGRPGGGDRPGGGGPGWGGGNGGGWGMPGGSWQQSCRGIDMRGSFVMAECRTINRKWRETRIDTRSCRSNRLANLDGRLVCG
jgi:hypothetical protein